MTTTITSQEYDQMAALCTMGVNMAKIGDDYFMFSTFEPSSSGTTSSIDFNVIYGICVTDFMKLTRYDATTKPEAFHQQFERWIMNKVSMRVKFNKLIPYFIFST